MALCLWVLSMQNFRNSVTKPYNMKFLHFCALAHVHISSVLLPLLQRTINLSIYLSTTHFLKRKSQHWFKSKYAAETRDIKSDQCSNYSETWPGFVDHMSAATQCDTNLNTTNFCRVEK